MVNHDIQELHISNILELEMTAFDTKCECPKCFQQAQHVSWEKLEFGVVNRYWRIFCDTCGHVDTNEIY